jgi:hypothetical protein
MSSLDREGLLLAIWILIAMAFSCAFGFVLAGKISKPSTLIKPSGKGWEILVEEAQAVTRRAVEDLQLANTTIRVQRREIAELKFENIRLQAELTEKDIPTS